MILWHGPCTVPIFPTPLLTNNFINRWLTFTGTIVVEIASLELRVIEESLWAVGDVFIVARTEDVASTVNGVRVEDIILLTVTQGCWKGQQ